jgi:hypothetical protein
VCDLLDCRAAVVAKLKDLFADAPDELKKLAEEKLPKDAAAELVKAVK